ncbi:hypothetical protein [Microbispora corallina]|uniref:hypothetical protein n=1 Tax=Microbispora corallina TaxID=83302 RepID=UPI0019518A55|nr:hypothetical protein [Microbispora corallina]
MTDSTGVTDPVPALPSRTGERVAVPREPSLAARPVEERPVGPEPPPVTIPAGPVFMDGVTAEVRARLSAAGLPSRGGAAPRPEALLPATGAAGRLGVTRPPDGEVARAAETVGGLGGPDLTRLYRSRPEGVPVLTYRLCAESPSLPVACSAPRPLLHPAAADVTGDGTPDVLADLVPARDPGDVLRAADALAGHLPLGGSPGRRDRLAATAAAGLGLLTRRLPGGDTAGRDLRAQVWAEYSLGDRLIRVGVDGYRRGASLSDLDWGLYTVTRSSSGAIDVRADVRHRGPGASIATVAGTAGADGGRSAGASSLVSLRQAPVPETLSVHARVETATSAGTLTVTVSRPSALDALALSGDSHRSRVTRLLADRVTGTATARLTRAADGAAGLSLDSGAAIGTAEFGAYAFGGGRLDGAAGISVTRLPGRLRARYEPGPRSRLTVDTGSPTGTGVRMVYADRSGAGTAFRAALTDVPGHLELVQRDARLALTASGALGGLDAVLQRGGGAVSSPPGAHVTVIKDGSRLGVSGRLSNLDALDVAYGTRPHAALRLAAGGRPFLGAASVDGRHLARIEISDTPAEVEVDVDPAARKAVYRASGTIDRIRAAYADTTAGPTIDGTVEGVRSSVAASWDMGGRTVADVATPAGLRAMSLYVNRRHVTSVGPRGRDDLFVTAEGIGAHVGVAADPAAGAFTWTADRPVASLSAFARTGGVRVAARATGVPARFDATWAGGTYAVRGVSGPFGSLAIAVTDHDGATAPTGPHVAAHLGPGRFDASLRLDGLSSLRLSDGAGGLDADVRAARQTVALDVDALLPGDLRAGALGTLGPVPGHLRITAAPGGVVGYETDAPMDLRADVWLGKAAAVERAPAVPAVANGLALADARCAAGSRGCAADGGPFCRTGGCFGLRGTVRLSLPAKATLDLAHKTVTFSGYRAAGRDLQVYLGGSAPGPAPFRALATLRGLPGTVTRLSVGPFGVAGGSGGGTVDVGYAVEPATPMASLEVRGETRAGGRTVRGQVVVEKVPASVAITAAYGARTRLTVRDSAPIDALTARVTVVPRKGRPGTGGVRFTGVPATFAVDAAASVAGLRVPALTYTADAATLDGTLAVQGALARLAVRGARPLDSSISFTDLAPDTTVRLNDDLSIDLASRPVPTGSIEIHAGLAVPAVRRQRVSYRTGIPYTGGFFGLRMNGHYGAGPSRVADLSVGVHAMSWLRIRPGRIPFGLAAPPALGFLTPGFEGVYDHLDIRTDGVDLRPDVKLAVRIDRAVGADAFRDTLRLGPATSLRLRRYDGVLRPISARQPVGVGPARLACLTIGTRPGLAAPPSTGAITLRGADGPQVVSLLDPGGQVPGYAVDLLAHMMSPFDAPALAVTGFTPGDCAGDPQ